MRSPRGGTPRWVAGWYASNPLCALRECLTAFRLYVRSAQGRQRRRTTAPTHLIVGPLEASKLAFLNDGGALPAAVGLRPPS
jgi:hypothetical protein